MFNALKSAFVPFAKSVFRGVGVRGAHVARTGLESFGNQLTRDQGSYQQQNTFSDIKNSGLTIIQSLPWMIRTLPLLATPAGQIAVVVCLVFIIIVFFLLFFTQGGLSSTALIAPPLPLQ